jgi:hypothetical protein
MEIKKITVFHAILMIFCLKIKHVKMNVMKMDFLFKILNV